MKKIFFVFATLLLTISCSGDKLNVVTGRAQGTTYIITYIGKEYPEMRKSLDSIFEVIDMSMSNYKSNSLITKINNGEKLKLDSHFKKVFLESKKVFEESDGYFDPSLGQIFSIWGFAEKKHGEAPTQKTIDSLLQNTGMDMVDIDNSDFLVKNNNNIKLNFNAIAQGYTSDVIGDFLKEKGYTNFIIEVGGEIFVSGRNTIKNKEWVIGIDDPLQNQEEERKILAKVQLKDCGLATSGNYRKVWTDSITGKKYVHTINPKTGYPEQNNVLSATIIAKTSMKADAYATSVMSLGFEKSKDFLKKHPEVKYFIVYQNEGGVKQYTNCEDIILK